MYCDWIHARFVNVIAVDVRDKPDAPDANQLCCYNNNELESFACVPTQYAEIELNNIIYLKNRNFSQSKCSTCSHWQLF